MSRKSPQQLGGSIAEGLERRAREGRPVRIGLIGAGQMGTDIIVQTDLMQGIEVVAAADAIPENVFAARVRFQIAGHDASYGAVAPCQQMARSPASPCAGRPRRFNGGEKGMRNKGVIGAF